MQFLKFSSPSCNPCKALGSYLEELGVQTTEINVEEEQDMVIQYRVRAVPTLVRLENGVEVDRIIGYDPKVKEKLKELVACE